ncbi:MAG TPA: cytochrome b N-terminal domain-containing protein [Anaerolineales bacterium]|nr:cytochrome b N-terminal domain-containing protein [Anaerolineales bacterium]
MRPSFLHHLHPPTIPAPQARWRYTLGAGGMAVFLTLVVGGTGALEMFYYVPTPEQAALSVQTITYLVPLGGLIRSLHYWSGQLLAGTIIVHLLRVLFTGGYSGPRRFNNLLGVSLLGGVILLDFTGYMLRWDQGIQWALVVGTNLLKTIPVVGPALFTTVVGGSELGAAALIRFYAWHVFGLALPFVFLGVWHLFRVRRDGGIAVPPPALRQDHTRITRHELVRREIVAALLTSAVLLAVATLRPAPLASPIVNMNELTSDALAPWFFLWVQQLLKWGDPFLLGVLLPMAILGSLAGVPYIARPVAPDELGRWFPTSGRAVQVAVGLIALALAILTALAFMPAS